MTPAWFRMLGRSLESERQRTVRELHYLRAQGESHMKRIASTQSEPLWWPAATDSHKKGGQS